VYSYADTFVSFEIGFIRAYPPEFHLSRRREPWKIAEKLHLSSLAFREKTERAVDESSALVVALLEEGPLAISSTVDSKSLSICPVAKSATPSINVLTHKISSTSKP
jgi:hypothetical protein